MKIFLNKETDKPQLTFDNNFNPILVGSQEQRASYYRNKKNMNNNTQNSQISANKSLFKILLEAIQDTELMMEIPRFFFFFKNQVGITEVSLNDRIQMVYF